MKRWLWRRMMHWAIRRMFGHADTLGYAYRCTIDDPDGGLPVILLAQSKEQYARVYETMGRVATSGEGEE
jgi:hypothetical protein